MLCAEKNKSLNDNSDKKYESEVVETMGFTGDVPVYMNAVDMVFTKPGGLSSTEAATLNIPLVHTAPIPGCETINAKFFSDRGCLLHTGTSSSLLKGHVLCLTTNMQKKKCCSRKEEI